MSLVGAVVEKRESGRQCISKIKQLLPGGQVKYLSRDEYGGNHNRRLWLLIMITTIFITQVRLLSCGHIHLV